MFDKFSESVERFGQNPRQFVTFMVTFIVSVMLLGTLAACEIKWWEENPAYYTKNQHYLSSYLFLARGHLIKAGGDKEGALASSLKWMHEKVTNSALKKLPPGDGERLIYEIEYALLPDLVKPTPQTLPQVMPRVVHYAAALAEAPIAIRELARKIVLMWHIA